MKITTKLRIGYIFSALIVILAGVIILISFKQMRIKDRELKLVDAISQNVFELNFLSNEYLMYREKRPRIQWDLKYKVVSRLLGDGKIHASSNQSILIEIREDLGLIRTHFLDLVSLHATSKAIIESGLHQQNQNRLQSLLRLKLERVLSNSVQLKNQIKDELIYIQQYTNWMSIALIAATALLSVIIGLIVGRSITSPIKTLMRGVESIGSGNLGVRLNTVNRKDEIGYLSKSFEQMVNNLKTVMVSRDELERRVEERTAKLAASNRLLTSEIEERKHAEEELQISEVRYRTVADFTYDWEVWANNDGSLEYVSPSCERISGYSVREFLDNPALFREIIVPEDREIWDKHSHDSRNMLKPLEAQFRIQRKDGEIRWIEHACQPLTGNPGDPAGFRTSNRDITSRKLAEIALRDAFAEIQELKSRLEAESAYLQEEIRLEHNFENIIGQSQALKYVLHRVEQVSSTESPVLILGETGTGKELVARAIHRICSRSKRVLVKVNCAALPRDLVESELFGHEKGAFTGATTRQLGRFEIANGSTLFLDEIGEMPLELQAKLLRVLESGEFERVGNPKTMHSDARIIASTNRVLEEEVRKGRFREDLWYRLKVFTVTMPPLRKRKEDIPLLVKWFAEQSSRAMGKRDLEISKQTMQSIQDYPWPGNVRELKHVVESAIITAEGTRLDFVVEHAAEKAYDEDREDFRPFEDMERDYIIKVLRSKNWKIQGENSAASVLRMHPNTLRARIKKLGIERP